MDKREKKVMPKNFAFLELFPSFVLILGPWVPLVVYLSSLELIP